MEDKERDGCASSSVDRMSQLPQHILQHILYFLSQKEAAQTSLLSKAWRYTWSTRPNIEFDQLWFEKAPQEFFSILNKTLRAYHDQKLCIQEIRVLTLSVSEDPESISLHEKWIKIAMNMGSVKQFHLSHGLAYDHYDMPRALFEAKSLQDLRLFHCGLGRTSTPDEILFKKLKKLGLVYAHVEEEVFTKIISSCPLIEDIMLYGCEGLTNIKMNGLHSLKNFYFAHYNYCVTGDNRIEDTRIEIKDLPNLERIDIRGIEETANSLRYCHEFPNLKSLALYGVPLSSESFVYFSCKYLHSLEKLSIDDCYGFQEFQLTSHTIKCFYLSMIEQEYSIKAAIDTPNMAIFDYGGSCLPSLSFARTCSEWKSCIVLGFDGAGIDDVSTWFLKLHDLLRALSLSRSRISLTIVQDHRNIHQQIVDFENTGNLHKPVVRVECLEICGHPSACSAILNFCFRIFRPMRMDYRSHLEDSTDSTESKMRRDLKVTEFLCEIVKEITHRQQFWLQDLEEVNMDAFDQEDPSYETKSPDIRFQLKWRKDRFDL